jgi:hypothetical protein
MRTNRSNVSLQAFLRVAASRADYTSLGDGACVASGNGTSTAQCTSGTFATEATCRHKCDWLEPCIGYTWHANGAHVSLVSPCRCVVSPCRCVVSPCRCVVLPLCAVVPPHRSRMCRVYPVRGLRYIRRHGGVAGEVEPPRMGVHRRLVGHRFQWGSGRIPLFVERRVRLAPCALRLARDGGGP